MKIKVKRESAKQASKKIKVIYRDEKKMERIVKDQAKRKARRLAKQERRQKAREVKKAKKMAHRAEMRALKKQQKQKNKVKQQDGEDETMRPIDEEEPEDVKPDLSELLRRIKGRQGQTEEQRPRNADQMAKMDDGYRLAKDVIRSDERTSTETSTSRDSATANTEEEYRRAQSERDESSRSGDSEEHRDRAAPASDTQMPPGADSHQPADATPMRSSRDKVAAKTAAKTSSSTKAAPGVHTGDRRAEPSPGPAPRRLAKKAADKEGNPKPMPRANMLCWECERHVFHYEDLEGNKSPVCKCHGSLYYGCFWQTPHPKNASYVQTFACYRANNQSFWGKANTKKGENSTIQMLVKLPGGKMRFDPNVAEQLEGK